MCEKDCSFKFQKLYCKYSWLAKRFLGVARILTYNTKLFI